MWCWSLPEIVTLSYEASDLRCEVWVRMFSVTLWDVFFVGLLCDCVELGNSCVNDCVVIGTRFMSSNCVSVSVVNLCQSVRL